MSISNYHFFLKGLDKGQTPELDPDKIRLAESRDGFYAIVTNVKDKTPVELFSQYKELWMVEDCFGELKGTLRAPYLSLDRQENRGALDPLLHIIAV